MSPLDWGLLGLTLATVGTLIALKVWVSKL